MLRPRPLPFTLHALRERWPEKSLLRGVLLFGSRARTEASRPDADWDIGIIYAGRVPELTLPPNWDIFCWDEEHWERGFVLQIEIARSALVLFDPDDSIDGRLSFLREKILPHWAGYLHRI